MTSRTRTSLINEALREIGTDRIEDADERTVEADVARDVYDKARRMSLARHGWRFAIKGASLARSSETPATRYDYLYTLPGDFVRLEVISEYQTMEPPLEAFTFVSQGVLTSAALVYIEYVYDAPPEGAWPSWFADLFVADLASLMSSPLKSETVRERMEQLANNRLATARSLDSQHRPVKRYREGNWVTAMRGARSR